MPKDSSDLAKRMTSTRDSGKSSRMRGITSCRHLLTEIQESSRRMDIYADIKATCLREYDRCHTPADHQINWVTEAQLDRIRTDLSYFSDAALGRIPGLDIPYRKTIRSMGKAVGATLELFRLLQHHANLELERLASLPQRESQQANPVVSNNPNHQNV